MSLYRKIIRSRDVIFNENVMYKDRSIAESSSSSTEAETKEFVEFEEIFGNDVQISPEAVQEEPGTPALNRSNAIRLLCTTCCCPTVVNRSAMIQVE